MFSLCREICKMCHIFHQKRSYIVTIISFQTGSIFNLLHLLLKTQIHHFQSNYKAHNPPHLRPSSAAPPPDSLSDSLLLWLSGELSEEEVALLVLHLRLRRSAAQLVKLRAGDSVSTQAFHVLAMWRRGLPAAPRRSKASLLARCLAKSGRTDLGRELLLRQAAATKLDPLKPGHPD